MPDLQPVDYDPFAPTLTPVDHDPFTGDSAQAMGVGGMTPDQAAWLPRLGSAIGQEAANIGSGIASAVTLPGDVMQGNVQVGSPEMIQRGLNLAGMMTGSGIATGVETLPGEVALGSGLIKKVSPVYANPETRSWMMPVEMAADSTLNPWETKLDILDGGHIRVRSLNGDRSVPNDEIHNAISSEFDPKYEGFFRFTNNPNEPALAAAGKLRKSRNYADNITEGGVSVATGPHYSVEDYKYGYRVNGNQVGVGSDGEPLLDQKSLQVLSPIQTPEEINALHFDQLNKNLQARGWDPEHKAAFTYKPLPSDRFSDYVRYLEPVDHDPWAPSDAFMQQVQAGGAT